MFAINVPVYPHFEEVMGYSGGAAVVMFSWYQDSWDDTLFWSDGIDEAKANVYSWYLFEAHPKVKMNMPKIKDGECIVLDREQRKLYRLSKADGLKLVLSNHTFNSYSPFDATGQGWEKAKHLVSDFIVWLGNQEPKPNPLQGFMPPLPIPDKS